MKINFIHQINMVLFFTVCFAIKSTQAQNDSTTTLPIAAKEKVEITAEVNYLKHYLWRAILFGSDDVSQPSVAIGYKHFFVNLGCNINYIPKNLPEEFYSKKVMYDEQDVEIGYGNSIKKLDYEIKTMAYYYFNQIGSPNTKEASLKLSYPVIKNITAFTETVVDIQSYKGSVYNNTGTTWEYSHKKNDFLLQANAGFGSNKFTAAYFGTEEDAAGLLYWGGKAAITHNFKNFYCTLAGEYNVYANKSVKVATDINNTSNFILTLGKAF
jgi:hypothetical protein